MSEKADGVSASEPDKRSVIIESFGERPVPSVDQLVADFTNRRADIEMRLRDLEAQSSIQLDILQAQERRARIAESKADLAELNDLWQGLGGDKIDEASNQVDELNFKSDATDRIRANGNLRDVKSAFYNNFVALHEEALEHTETPNSTHSDELPSNHTQKIEVTVASDEQQKVSGETSHVPVTDELSQETIDQLQAIIDRADEESFPQQELSDETRKQLEKLAAREPQESTQRPESEPITSENRVIDESESISAYFRKEFNAAQREESRRSNEAYHEQIKEMTRKRLEASQDRYIDETIRFQSKNFFGRKNRNRDPSRQDALDRAWVTLASSQARYVNELVDLRKEAGEYTGTEEEIAAAMNNDRIHELMRLDKSMREATTRAYLEKKEGRGLFERGLAKMGGWVNKFDSKKKQWAVLGGSGALFGIGTALSGVGWPITTAVSAGASASIYHGSKIDVLDKKMSSNNHLGMSPEEVESYLKELKEQNGDISDADALSALSKKFYEQSRDIADTNRREARATALANMKKFGIGFAVGSIGVASTKFVASEVHEAFGHHDAISNTPQQHVSTAPSHASSSGSGSGSVAGSAHHVGGSVTGHEFPANAAHIGNGEGWFHQLGDMGYNSDQINKLYGNHTLMNKLAKQGVAYRMPDGGYGISHTGVLPDSAMRLIKATGEASGF